MKRITKLFDRLQEEHVKYNQEVENYEENGEEDFEIWLKNNLSEYILSQEVKP